jgi:UDP-N-acetylmuramoylalanine--D-glutamate ligase
MDVRGKRVAVLGLGVSGLWTARWLSTQGADFIVTDNRPESQIGEGPCAEVRSLGGKLETGCHSRATVLGADMIVISPGVPHEMVLLEEARKRGIPVLGELELAFRVLKGAGGPPLKIVAVTGTNGKSTVTELIGYLLELAGIRAFVGGNLGTPLMALACEKERPGTAVVEVSSFQLDTIETFSPFISVSLNITPDHLDRYRDYESYVRSKLRIFENQGKGAYAVINDDDEALSSCILPAGVTGLRYGLEPIRRGNDDKPLRQAFFEKGRITAFVDGRRHEFTTERFALPGNHNRSNLLSVVLSGLCLGIEDQFIQRGIDSFKGLRHRIEFIGEMKGVKFYDDSKATNLDAAVKAVESFKGPIILIAGGRHKGAEYGPLVRACEGKVKEAVFLGESRMIFAAAFEGKIPYRIAADMKDAVRMAFRSAEPGDTILLAPACSSFDMYRDYAHRGKVFAEEVRRLGDG